MEHLWSKIDNKISDLETFKRIDAEWGDETLFIEIDKPYGIRWFYSEYVSMGPPPLDSTIYVSNKTSSGLYAIVLANNEINTLYINANQNSSIMYSSMTEQGFIFWFTY